MVKKQELNESMIANELEPFLTSSLKKHVFYN